MEQKEFKRLLTSCSEFSELYPKHVVFIGGIAVYLHTIHVKKLKPVAETTHDADFYISVSAMGDLREQGEVHPNTKHTKHMLYQSKFEFDIYTEHHSHLIVPYADVASHAVRYEPYSVACLEHLLALKLEAYEKRRGSSIGMKDAKDIFRIALCAKTLGFHRKFYRPYQMDAHEKLIVDVIKSPAAVELAWGNSVLTKKYRFALSKLLDLI